MADRSLFMTTNILARVFKTEIFHTIEVTASIWLPFLPLGQKKGIGAARNFARGPKGDGRSLDRPTLPYLIGFYTTTMLQILSELIDNYFGLLPNTPP